MIAQPHDLILERSGNELNLLWGVNTAKALVAGRPKIVFPLPMTTPAHQDQQSQFVAEVIEVL